jgi:uncharacterized phage protein gp47/JayE
MTDTYDRIEDDRNIGEATDEWQSAIDIAPQSNTYQLLRALLSQADRIDADLEDIYNDHHIDSADGTALDVFGSLVNIDRNTDESDNKFRARIKAQFRASTIGTTYDEYLQFVAAVLQTNVGNIELSTNYDGNPATVSVSTQSSVYENIDLTPTETQEILGSGVPAGHEVNALEIGTFRLKQDGETDTAENGLTSDSISTGGTLAADLT